MILVERLKIVLICQPVEIFLRPLGMADQRQDILSVAMEGVLAPMKKHIQNRLMAVILNLIKIRMGGRNVL